ncbi:hypothetical protein GFB49_04200 [Epibacterium sp. SM1979]|uniref:Uncharacterized protein n=1 Tax=Tritonibacter litoralis TaxID=2662264 RepID=A0A843YEX3_9RHOB|nr:hypothetical protein [Tritonibacter litoralis]MQQ07649.1 hypothetical protein [Tritonibacter litoralis]
MPPSPRRLIRRTAPTALATLIALALAPAALAQTAPLYDPSAVPFAPSRLSLDHCPTAAIADPRWSRKTKRDSNANGVSIYSYSFALDRPYWSRHPRPYDQLTVNPHGSLSYHCQKFTGELAGFAERYHASILAMSKREKHRSTHKVRPLQRITHPQFGQIFYFLEEKNTQQGDQTWFYTVDTLTFALKSNGTLMHGRFALSRAPDEALMRVLGLRKTRPGKIVEGTLKTGETLRAKMATTTYRTDKGLVYYFRKRKDNIALFDLVLNAL